MPKKNAFRRFRRRFSLWFVPVTIALTIALVTLSALAFSGDQTVELVVAAIVSICLFSPFLIVPASYLAEYYFDSDRSVGLHIYIGALVSFLSLPFTATFMSALALAILAEVQDISELNIYSPSDGLWPYTESAGFFEVRESFDPCGAALHDAEWVTLQDLDSDNLFAFWTEAFFDGVTLGALEHFGCEFSGIAANPSHVPTMTVTYIFEAVSSAVGLALLLGPFIVLNRLVRSQRRSPRRRAA